MSDLDARLEHALADRWAVERQIGRGGMAIVYLARDLRHSRRVALKVLAPELAQALGPDRFLREIEIASELSHPRGTTRRRWRSRRTGARWVITRKARTAET